MFLFTEGQITNERFLVYLNDLLSSGEIADLFPAEDVDGIVNNVRNAVKSEGILDSKDNCWKFFIDRVRRNLHMSMCFSPVGDAFRNRARKFPAIINCSVIDWFHPWPEEALLSVAAKFLADVEMATPEIREGIEKFMPYSFKVVNEYSD
jgi:dynein heavy chain